MKELDKVKNINNNQIEKTVQIGSIYDDYQIFYDIAFKENEPINNDSLDYKEENYFSECKKNIVKFTEIVFEEIHQNMERSKSVLMSKQKEEIFPMVGKWKSSKIIKNKLISKKK